jgi:citrate lyase subunit beta/citryl-CoA lyase
MIPRSYLFVPGDRPDRFEKARASGAHVAILDLEDAVADGHKDAAREAVAAWLAAERPVYVRVNAPHSFWFAQDLAVLGLPGVAGVLVPKVETAEQLAPVAAALPGDAPIVPIVESAKGVWGAQAIAEHPRVPRLIFGSWDFQLDVGIAGDSEELLYARSHLVLMSRLAGVLPPVDGVTAALEDPAQLQADIERSRRLGFGGKLCIHPKQIAAVNAGYGPTPDEITWARQIVAATAASESGALRAAGQMVDRPVIERALRIVAEADGTSERDQ